MNDQLLQVKLFDARIMEGFAGSKIVEDVALTLPIIETLSLDFKALLTPNLCLKLKNPEAYERDRFEWGCLQETSRRLV